MKTLAEVPKLPPDTMLTPPKIAEILGVTSRTIQRYVKSGKYPNATVIPSGWQIPWGDVLDHLKSLEK